MSTSSHLAVGALAGALASSAAMRISTSNRSLNDASDHADSTPSATGSSKGSGGGRSGGGRAFPSDKHVGILAMEVYVPSTYVSQSALEGHCGVSSGRYTIGLGQESIGLVGDCEDVNSLALTVVHNLLEKYDVDPAEIGRLEVGTETLVDKSKSTKTVLMDLFGEDNTDVEGATVINACYGGTAALFNAFAWVESDGWDGRFAIVVAADIAAYARGPARPTCGAGAVAVLVGRDAPLAFSDPRERATHASNVWDFFKPDHRVEYPAVDGAHSQECYYRALEDCYARFADRVERLEAGATIIPPGKRDVEQHVKPFRATDPDYLVFHAPYNKLVQKSYARLFLLDAKRDHDRSSRRIKLSESGIGEEKKKEPASDDEDDDADAERRHPLHKWSTKPREEWSQTYADRELEGVLKKMSAGHFADRLGDANAASREIGNTYTASVFFGLASLVDRCGADPSSGDGLTPGKTVVVFSYGSGAIASMYRLHVRAPSNGRFTLAGMARRLDLRTRLGAREEVDPSELDLALDTRERMHSRPGAAYSPVYPTVGRMFPGTYYLSSVDSSWRRVYSRVPPDADRKPGGSLAPPIVLRRAREESCRGTGTPVTGLLSVLSGESKNGDAARRISCVITGVSAGLPGRSSGRPVFAPDNLERLVRGEQCIEPVSGSTISALQEKNVVRLKKLPDGTAMRIPLRAESDVIRLAAQLGPLDLSGCYGVPPGLAETMDVAAQVAVAAGMEALKSAGLVMGRSNDPAEWRLPDDLRDTTGVVYASSFPAMDAAVGEVMRFLQSKTVGAAPMERLVSGLRNRLLRASPDRELSDDDEAALARLLSRARETEGGGAGNDEEGGGKSASSDSSSTSSSSSTGSTSTDVYEFDRKFLFRVLVLGNAQLAQLAGCRGPNTQTNAACAGTTQAIAMAQDMLISGRAERVVVVAGDNASGDTLLPWLGSGFSALGAATTESAVEDAALPFDKRRNGMLLGAGGIGMVLETEESALERSRLSEERQPGGGAKLEMKARLLATQYSNSAFHGAALDRKHIASELKRFLRDVEAVHGICKAEVAAHGVYFSHETCTHASSASSCAGNEVAALREAFGDELLSKLLVLNTKGFTGHPMGVSFEDVTAVEVLMRQEVPPIVNHRVKDEYLGELNLSRGGSYSCRYALRFAAGFGSQVAFALYATAQDD